MKKGPHFQLFDHMNKQVSKTQKPTQAYLLKNRKRGSELLQVAPTQVLVWYILPVHITNS